MNYRVTLTRESKGDLRLRCDKDDAQAIVDVINSSAPLLWLREEHEIRVRPDGGTQKLTMPFGIATSTITGVEVDVLYLGPGPMGEDGTVLPPPPMEGGDIPVANGTVGKSDVP